MLSRVGGGGRLPRLDKSRCWAFLAVYQLGLEVDDRRSGGSGGAFRGLRRSSAKAGGGDLDGWLDHPIPHLGDRTPRERHRNQCGKHPTSGKVCPMWHVDHYRRSEVLEFSDNG